MCQVLRPLAGVVTVLGGHVQSPGEGRLILLQAEGPGPHP